MTGPKPVNRAAVIFTPEAPGMSDRAIFPAEITAGAAQSDGRTLAAETRSSEEGKTGDLLKIFFQRLMNCAGRMNARGGLTIP